MKAATTLLLCIGLLASCAQPYEPATNLGTEQPKQSKWQETKQTLKDTWTIPSKAKRRASYSEGGYRYSSHCHW